MTTVHIEGLGLLGSLTALTLENQGIPFTWHDTEEEVNAWQASTGTVFPTGDERDYECYEEIIDMIHGRDVFGGWIRQFCERGQWSYVSASPPHDGDAVGVRTRAAISESDLVVSNKSTLHLNVQEFVERTRERYKALRWSVPHEADYYVVSHGFSRSSRYGWGWHREVQLALSSELEEALRGTRPCIYLRKGYQVMYIYPMPMTDSYYMGTSNHIASKPKTRTQDELEEKFLKVYERLDETCGGHVVLKRAKNSFAQGWRPYTEKGEDTPQVYEEDGKIYIRPQKGSGLRYWAETSRLLLVELT